MNGLSPLDFDPENDSSETFSENDEFRGFSPVLQEVRVFSLHSIIHNTKSCSFLLFPKKLIE